jgi:hypothetical protein
VVLQTVSLELGHANFVGQCFWLILALQNSNLFGQFWPYKIGSQNCRRNKSMLGVSGVCGVCVVCVAYVTCVCGAWPVWRVWCVACGARPVWRV